jgi:hypothetical protein
MKNANDKIIAGMKARNASDNAIAKQEIANLQFSAGRTARSIG